MNSDLNTNNSNDTSSNNSVTSNEMIPISSRFNKQFTRNPLAATTTAVGTNTTSINIKEYLDEEMGEKAVDEEATYRIKDSFVEGTLLHELYRDADTEVVLQTSSEKRVVTPQQKAEIRMVLVLCGFLLPRSKQAKYYNLHTVWFYLVRCVYLYCCICSLAIVIFQIVSAARNLAVTERGSKEYFSIIGQVLSFVVFYVQIPLIVDLVFINVRRLNSVCSCIDIWAMYQSLKAVKIFLLICSLFQLYYWYFFCYLITFEFPPPHGTRRTPGYLAIGVIEGFLTYLPVTFGSTSALMFFLTDALSSHALVQDCYDLIVLNSSSSSNNNSCRSRSSSSSRSSGISIIDYWLFVNNEVERRVNNNFLGNSILLFSAIMNAITFLLDLYFFSNNAPLLFAQIVLQLIVLYGRENIILLLLLLSSVRVNDLAANILTKIVSSGVVTSNNSNFTPSSSSKLQKDCEHILLLSTVSPISFSILGETLTSSSLNLRLGGYLLSILIALLKGLVGSG